MPSPSWLGYVLSGAVAVVGVYCVARFVARVRRRQREDADVALAHVLMAVATAGMLVPSWNVLPVWAGVGIFSALGIYFSVIAIQGASHGAVRAGPSGAHVRHALIHGVMAGAMLYMYWLGMPMTSSGGRGGMSMSMSGAASGGDPALTFLLTVVLLASAVWQLDGVGRLAQSRSRSVLAGVMADAPAQTVEAPAATWLAPQYAAGCHIAMCVVMAYMLVIML